MPRSTVHGLAKDEKTSALPSGSDGIVPQAPSLFDIKKSIPEELFRPSVVKSVSYVVLDLSLVAVNFLVMYYMQHTPYVSTILWPLYWFMQGTLFWSIFVLGHDCGHGSFSRYRWVNNTFGSFLHSFILVPYHMWRLTHRHHHKNTGNFEKDEIFYPVPVEEKHPVTPAAEVMIRNYFYMGIGFAVYLAVGFPPRSISHFDLREPIFQHDYYSVLSSLIGWWSMAICLIYAGFTYGGMQVASFYLVPWLVFASWLVVTTFLHHNEPGVPWFSNKKWNYVLGNLSSVDRDYGVLHKLTHDIGTHQVHHLFPKIPHYNLQEATKHFRKAFPDLVRRSDKPILPTFFQNAKIYAEQYLFSFSDVFVYKIKSK